MADRVVESSDKEVPEIPDLLERVLVYVLSEARGKLEAGEEVAPFTALAIKDKLFIETHPADQVEDCFKLAEHTVKNARGAEAYGFCYDGFIELDDQTVDALIAEGGVPGDSDGFAVAFVYTASEDGSITFEDTPTYVGPSPNFMGGLMSPDDYRESELDSKYRSILHGTPGDAL